MNSHSLFSVDLDAPFGGVKESGMGYNGTRAGLSGYVQLRDHQQLHGLTLPVRSPPMAASDAAEPDIYEPQLGNLLWHVRLTERTMERTLRRMIAGTNITKAQFGTMQVLVRVRQASSAALARMLSVSPQAMVDLVAQLERKGYLERETVTSPAGRMINAQLTRSGRAAFAKAADRFEQLDKRLDAEFDDDEREQLTALLARMRTVLDDFAAESGSRRR